MLKKRSMRSFIWSYSLFYCFYRFQVIHSLNDFPLLVIVCVSILSLPMERYKSKDISIITRTINKWTTSHESSLRARFHNVNIFFMEFILSSKNSTGPWMMSITVSNITGGLAKDPQEIFSLSKVNWRCVSSELLMKQKIKIGSLLATHQAEEARACFRLFQLHLYGIICVNS